MRTIHSELTKCLQDYKRIYLTLVKYVVIGILGLNLSVNGELSFAQSVLPNASNITMTENVPPRVERDTVRERIWTLSNQSVHLYDARSKSLMRKFVLSDWNVGVDPYGCSADLMVDWSGNVYVTSGSTSSLMRIDANTLQLERIDLNLNKSLARNAGFTGLMYIDKERFLAVSSLEGSLWSINIATKQASKIELTTTLYGACSLGFIVDPRLDTQLIDDRGSPTQLICATTNKSVHMVELDDLFKVVREGSVCVRS